MHYIDTHSHLHDRALYEKLDFTISKMKEEGIASITIGTDYQTSTEAKALATNHDSIFYTIGVHPCDDEIANFDENDFEKLLSDRCVAVGECGLDYFYFEKNKIKNTLERERDQSIPIYNIDREIDRQQRLFIQQIEFAKKHKLALMLHGRPSAIDKIDNPTGMDAYEDMIYILEHAGPLPTSPARGGDAQSMIGNVHFFVGDIEIAKRFIDLGFDFSFGGVLTLTHDYDEVVRYIPIDRIHAETDSPYVSPKDKDGKRASIPNTPLNIKIIIEKIAEIKNLDVNVVAIELLKNTERLYGIKFP